MKVSILLFVLSFALVVSSGLFTNLKDRYKLQVKLPFWKANGAKDPIDQQPSPSQSKNGHKVDTRMSRITSNFRHRQQDEKSYLIPLTELLRRSVLLFEETSQQIKATALSEVDLTVITYQESLVEPSVEDSHLVRKQQTLNQLVSKILARNSSSHRLKSPTRSVEKKITRHSVTSSVQFNGDYLPIQSSIEIKEDDLKSVAFVGLETCQSEPKWLPLVKLILYYTFYFRYVQIVSLGLESCSITTFSTESTSVKFTKSTILATSVATSISVTTTSSTSVAPGFVSTLFSTFATTATSTSSLSTATTSTSTSSVTSIISTTSTISSSTTTTTTSTSTSSTTTTSTSTSTSLTITATAPPSSVVSLTLTSVLPTTVTSTPSTETSTTSTASTVTSTSTSSSTTISTILSTTVSTSLSSTTSTSTTSSTETSTVTSTTTSTSSSTLSTTSTSISSITTTSSTTSTTTTQTTTSQSKTSTSSTLIASIRTQSVLLICSPGNGGQGGGNLACTTTTLALVRFNDALHAELLEFMPNLIEDVAEERHDWTEESEEDLDWESSHFENRPPQLLSSMEF